MGGGSQRGPLLWTRPGPVGLRGIWPLLCPGGRKTGSGQHGASQSHQVCYFRCSGCSLCFELPCRLANSDTATSCQHMAPTTDLLAPGSPMSRPNVHLPREVCGREARLDFMATCPAPLL